MTTLNVGDLMPAVVTDVGTNVIRVTANGTRGVLVGRPEVGKGDHIRVRVIELTSDGGFRAVLLS